MAVNLTAPRSQDLFPVKGVTLGVAEAGIRKAGRKDLMVMQLAESSSVGAVFTQNRFCAAPVQVSKLHLAQGNIRALVVNTGNANAGTGESGLQHTHASCEALAAQLGLAPQQVLPFSTGVIMEPLPIDKLIAGLPAAVANAAENQWADAAQAIMTTDTLPKAFSERVQVGEQIITVTGISKGAGMIRPNMATMLGFMATDACIAPALMKGLAHELAEQSFNRITIDGDTSTNDSFVVVATHQAGNTPLENWDSPLGAAVKAALYKVSRLLAQAIVRDGEGATKFMTISITGGRDAAECRQVAYAIAHSPLVKTAFFASDPNLGRILAAVGYAGVADLDQSLISLWLDDVLVVQNGGRNPAYQEEQGQRVMKQTEITVRVDLGRGTAQDSVWTCDLSYEYVKINADYRS